MSLNIKIAIFCPSLSGGGAERVALTLAEGFLSEGYEVDFVVAVAKGEYKNFISKNINIVDLGCSSTIGSIFRLVKYLRNNRPKVLLSIMVQANITAILARLLSFIKFRLVLSEHSILSLNWVDNSFWLYRYNAILAKVFYPFSNKIIAVSTAVSDDLVKYIPRIKKKVYVVSNPVDIDRLKLRKNRSSLNIDQKLDFPLVLATGRLVKQKGYETLLKAFAIVRRRRSGKLVILGEGGLRNRIMALAEELSISEDVYLPGFVSDTESYFSQAKAFVFPSLYEGFGLALLEALVFDVPVIATTCPGASCEILNNGQLGELVPPGDEGALASAIENALDGHVTIDRESRDRKLLEFKPNIIVNKYLRILLGDE
jgi:glycosyltransferase involved in cell wall biosynthesis